MDNRATGDRLKQIPTEKGLGKAAGRKGLGKAASRGERVGQEPANRAKGEGCRRGETEARNEGPAGEMVRSRHADEGGRNMEAVWVGAGGACGCGQGRVSTGSVRRRRPSGLRGASGCGRVSTESSTGKVDQKRAKGDKRRAEA